MRVLGRQPVRVASALRLERQPGRVASSLGLGRQPLRVASSSRLEGKIYISTPSS